MYKVGREREREREREQKLGRVREIKARELEEGGMRVGKVVGVF